MRNNFFLKIFILFFLMLSGSTLFSQELDTAVIDTVGLGSLHVAIEKPAYSPKRYLAVLGDIAYYVAPNMGGNNELLSIGGALAYKRWSAEFHVAEFRGTFMSSIVFPNNFSLDYKYGEAWIRYAFVQSKWLFVWSGVSYGSGEMIWRRVDNDEGFLADRFNIFKIGGLIELNRLHYLRPYFALGYQTTSNIDLVKIDLNDFAGIYFGAGIRMGVIRR